MCFALLALGQHPDYPFVLAANRDEFTNRPALAMHEWADIPGVLAGRDLESTGSWLALNKSDRRLALVTNVRDGTRQTAERSRGLLIRDLVDTENSLGERLNELVAEQAVYAGFNVLAGTVGGDMHYFSNRTQQPPQLLQDGVYGLSNAALDTPWPKVSKGKQCLHALLAASTSHTPLSPEDLFAILMDNEQAADEDLPDTGISLAWERWLSSLFIKGKDYRTRCSTVILMDKNKQIRCWERSFDDNGEYSDRHFVF